MNNLSQFILGQMQMSNMTVELLLPTLTRDQANYRGRGGNGGSIAWHIGHMLGYRVGMMAMLGEQRADPYAEQFGFPKPATDGADYPTPEALHGEWKELSSALTSRLETTTDEQLSAIVPSCHGDQELSKGFVFSLFHEAYHWGSIGTLLAEQGLATPSQRVMAMMEQQGE